MTLSTHSGHPERHAQYGDNMGGAALSSAWRNRQLRQRAGRCHVGHSPFGRGYVHAMVGNIGAHVGTPGDAQTQTPHEHLATPR